MPIVGRRPQDCSCANEFFVDAAACPGRIGVMAFLPKLHSERNNSSGRAHLKAALRAARKLRCHVAIAKLNRLSRDVHFISGLMAHKVPFLVASLGEARTRSCCTCLPL